MQKREKEKENKVLTTICSLQSAWSAFWGDPDTTNKSIAQLFNTTPQKIQQPTQSLGITHNTW